MNSPSPTRWPDRLLGAVGTLPLAAVMVFAAVQLLRAVLWWLVGIGVVVAAVALAVRLVRARGDRYW